MAVGVVGKSAQTGATTKKREREGGGGGGSLTTKGLNIIRSKSNSITFYGSLGMRNQVETRKERSQGTSIQQNSMHYLSREGGGGVPFTGQKL